VNLNLHIPTIIIAIVNESWEVLLLRSFWRDFNYSRGKATIASPDIKKAYYSILVGGDSLPTQGTYYHWGRLCQTLFS